MTGRLAHSRPTAGRQAHGECTDPGRAHGRRMAGALPAHGAHTASKHATPGPRQASWLTVCPWQAGGRTASLTGSRRAHGLRKAGALPAHGGHTTSKQATVGAPTERPRRQTSGGPAPKCGSAHGAPTEADSPARTQPGPSSPANTATQPACLPTQPSATQPGQASRARHSTAHTRHNTGWPKKRASGNEV